MIEFQGWPKTPRLNRTMIVSEKIDGTNAAVLIVPDPEPARHIANTDAVVRVEVGPDEYALVAAQSRKRLITGRDGLDNAGFAAWVGSHASDLVDRLGYGRHFGEWWGKGIQGGYGSDRRAFSLFNTHRYADLHLDFEDDTSLTTVPVLHIGPFDTIMIQAQIALLRAGGSVASPGFMRPEGVIVYHSASGSTFKAFLEGDDTHKGDQ